MAEAHPDVSDDDSILRERLITLFEDDVLCAQEIQGRDCFEAEFIVFLESSPNFFWYFALLFAAFLMVFVSIWFPKMTLVLSMVSPSSFLAFCFKGGLLSLLASCDHVFDVLFAVEEEDDGAQQAEGNCGDRD